LQRRCRGRTRDRPAREILLRFQQRATIGGRKGGCVLRQQRAEGLEDIPEIS
jgi:hypothetical protein